MLLPHYELLSFLNRTLLHYSEQHFTEDILVHLLWTLGNLLAEPNPLVQQAVLEQTALMAFVQAVLPTCVPSSGLLEILPWLLSLLVGFITDEDQLRMCLQGLAVVSGQASAYLQSQRKREKVVKDTLIGVYSVLSRNFNGFFNQVTGDFNIKDLIEFALAQSSNLGLTL